jgi:hypothetical protein
LRKTNRDPTKAEPELLYTVHGHLGDEFVAGTRHVARALSLVPESHVDRVATRLQPLAEKLDIRMKSVLTTIYDIRRKQGATGVGPPEMGREDTPAWLKDAKVILLLNSERAARLDPNDPAALEGAIAELFVQEITQGALDELQKVVVERLAALPLHKTEDRDADTDEQAALQTALQQLFVSRYDKMFKAVWYSSFVDALETGLISSLFSAVAWLSQHRALY